MDLLDEDKITLIVEEVEAWLEGCNPGSRQSIIDSTIERLDEDFHLSDNYPEEVLEARRRLA